jgi:hypothetical protein
MRCDEDLLASGFCMVLHWPSDVRLGVRGRRVDARTDGLDIPTFVTVMHEVGHALHYALLARASASFRQFYLSPPALGEAFAALAERQAFHPAVWSLTRLAPAQAAGHRAAWQRQQIWFLRRQIGRVRFEFDAYELALASPSRLDSAWESALAAATQVEFEGTHWAVDGHGFYTEDPMLRYAYLVSAGWADQISGHTWGGATSGPTGTPPALVQRMQPLVARWTARPAAMVGGLDRQVKEALA